MLHLLWVRWQKLVQARQDNDPKQVPGEDEARLQVIDLPSIHDPNLRLLAVSTVLESVWAKARQEWAKALRSTAGPDQRVPTFVVLDEAHNLIPSAPRNSTELRLLDQFQTIAAEGRKYGLFLVLVSQRPDKLNGLVISECENRAIMKVGSQFVLDKTRELLGLGDVPTRQLQKCLEFHIGRVLIVGPWAPRGSALLFGAARRTVEGGRNLRACYWAASEAAQVGGGAGKGNRRVPKAEMKRANR